MSKLPSTSGLVHLLHEVTNMHCVKENNDCVLVGYGNSTEAFLIPAWAIKCMMFITPWLTVTKLMIMTPLPRGGGGGGGGALGYLGGCIRSLSKLKNTPKALISSQKSTLILIKR